jgi:hypothetical protein
MDRLQSEVDAEEVAQRRALEADKLYVFQIITFSLGVNSIGFYTIFPE